MKVNFYSAISAFCIIHAVGEFSLEHGYHVALPQLAIMHVVALRYMELKQILSHLQVQKEQQAIHLSTKFLGCLGPQLVEHTITK